MYTQKNPNKILLIPNIIETVMFLDNGDGKQFLKWVNGHSDSGNNKKVEEQARNAKILEINNEKKMTLKTKPFR